MTALEILVKEHSLIRSFLDNLSLAAEKMERGEQPPAEFFEKAVEFARTYADRFHHFKEEHLMFVRLAQKQNGSIDARIEALRHQHERGRSLVSKIVECLPGYSREDVIRTTSLLESTVAYISLLRHHIHVEDHVFYPMVDSTLTPGELQQLQEEFEKQDRKAGNGTHEAARQLVRDMGSLLLP